MKYCRKLPTPSEIKEAYSIDEETRKKRDRRIAQVKSILGQNGSKKLLIIGPCSADNENAVLDYTTRLARLQERVFDQFIIIPRVYTSKPRTKGFGYKGILHRPDIYREKDDILSGVLAMRKLHLRVVEETEMFCADEMLYPESISYTDDLVAYLAVGARSVENQQHRLVASGMDIPVGMKNPTSGSMTQMLNAVLAAQNPHSMLYNGWEVVTQGNKYVHSILRGYLDSYEYSQPNYGYESLTLLYDKYIEYNLFNEGVIVDCNHSNSKKRYMEQVRIAKDVFCSCKNNKNLNDFIKGLMIESYIEDGAQLVGHGIYGKSITDPCLGWAKTERLVLDLCDIIQT